MMFCSARSERNHKWKFVDLIDCSFERPASNVPLLENNTQTLSVTNSRVFSLHFMSDHDNKDLGHLNKSEVPN